MPERLRFKEHLDPESGSVQRAREQEAAVAPVDDTGQVIIEFADSDATHEVTLRRDGTEWYGDCWALHENGDKHGRCKGLTYSDGPCAHLWRVRSAVARGDVEVPDVQEERADHHVEKVRADGRRRFDR